MTDFLTLPAISRGLVRVVVEISRGAAAFARPWVAGLVALGIGACASTPRAPFTAEEQALARIPGIPDARFWSDDPPAALRGEARMILLHSRGAPPAILALSGGGADGAFGAGLLVGWSRRGTRPEFAIVSGVSAGALLAPFAFLGPEYDHRLQEVFTGDYLSEFQQFNNVLGMLSHPNDAPLRRLTTRIVDQRMVERVAREHKRGRRLIVVTTNLDAQRSVAWNLGAIAASGRPDRLNIFRNILVASASVPGVFPPVLIDVAANGRHFAEMHVDGGVTHNVFIVPDTVLVSRGYLPAQLSGQIFVIVNKKVAPDFEVVENRPLPIIDRSISTMVKANTREILLATYQFARTHGIEFNLAAIDPSYPHRTTFRFDRDYMLRLFKYGLERARSGQVWQQSPFLQ
jgi:predicted acylesterase/phospholipase RssA